MALDLHILNAQGKPGQLLHQIELESYERMKLAWSLVKQRTGIEVDLYKDTRFSASSLATLVQAFQEAAVIEKDRETKQCMVALVEVLSRAESQGTAIGFFGD